VKKGGYLNIIEEVVGVEGVEGGGGGMELISAMYSYPCFVGGEVYTQTSIDCALPHTHMNHVLRDPLYIHVKLIRNILL
jgi:hypothetical protein